MKKILLMMATIGVAATAFADTCDCDNLTYGQFEKKACETAIIAVKRTGSVYDAHQTCETNINSDNPSFKKHLVDICKNKAIDYKSICY